MMSDTASEARFITTQNEERVLLLSHCLRPSQTCPGKFSREGLNCPAGCQEDCVIHRLRDIALKLGYKGVCIAAGGAMAVRYVKEHRPKGIVAVACNKELEEGVEAVGKLADGEDETPAVVTVPLLKDGCVDTEVDTDQVIRALNISPVSLGAK